MKVGRGFFVHLGLLALAVLAAVGVWTRDKQPKALSQAEVVVWPGRAADVERVAYESKTKKVTLEAKKDKEGSYYFVTVEKEAPAPGRKPDPTEEDGHEHGDEDDHDPDEPAATVSTGRTTSTFVSVGTGQKLVDSLAPLKAIRGVGRIGDDRAAEFGLSEPEGTLTVKIGGAERKLAFGGPTPGGGDRYARDLASGEVYALKGDVFRSVDSDSMLVERDPHEWKDADVTAATVTAGGKTRQVVRGGAEGKKFWADPASPDANDETVGNWMTKLDRLRPSEYVQLAAGAAEPIVRIEYTGRSGKIGYLELVKGAPGASGKPDYLIMTERTRLYAKVPPQAAEQVEQDVSSILK